MYVWRDNFFLFILFGTNTFFTFPLFISFLKCFFTNRTFLCVITWALCDCELRGWLGIWYEKFNWQTLKYVFFGVCCSLFYVRRPLMCCSIKCMSIIPTTFIPTYTKEYGIKNKGKCWHPLYRKFISSTAHVLSAYALLCSEARQIWISLCFTDVTPFLFYTVLLQILLIVKIFQLIIFPSTGESFLTSTFLSTSLFREMEVKENPSRTNKKNSMSFNFVLLQLLLLCCCFIDTLCIYIMYFLCRIYMLHDVPSKEEERERVSEWVWG